MSAGRSPSTMWPYSRGSFWPEPMVDQHRYWVILWEKRNRQGLNPMILPSWGVTPMSFQAIAASTIQAVSVSLCP